MFGSGLLDLQLECEAFVLCSQLKQQETPDGRWLCPDCTAGLQRCKLCGEVGPVGSGSLDDSDDEKAVKEKLLKPEVDDNVKMKA